MFYNYMGGEPYSIHDSVSSKHICILGSGGIGNHISYILASSGVKKLTVIDGDLIEDSNLTRQFLFSEENVGDLKTKTLKNEILKRNSNIEIDIINKYVLDDFSLIPKCDFLVVSADHPKDIMSKANEYCLDKNIPFINCGYFCDIAIIGPLVVPGISGCVFCGNDMSSKIFTDESERIKEEHKNKLNRIANNFQAPSISTINHIAAGYAALDIIKYLGGLEVPFSLNNRIGFHTSSLKIETQKNPLNSDCKKCKIRQVNAA